MNLYSRIFQIYNNQTPSYGSIIHNEGKQQQQEREKNGQTTILQRKDDQKRRMTSECSEWHNKLVMPKLVHEHLNRYCDL
jgi:hypothetical protein